MKKTFKYIMAVAMLAVSGSASTQNLSSAYFLDGFAQGHEINPAKEYDRKGYFGFPLSNINIGVKGNLNTSDVLFKNPNGSGLVTYLHPSISYEEAMKGFKDNNKTLVDLRFDLINVGFHAFKGYNTITVGLRANMGVNVPKELFDLTKKLTNKDYNISDFGATAMGWAEVGLGHSHQVTKAIRIGAKAKVLVGGGYVKMDMDNLSLDLQNVNKWTATANATVEAGVKGITWGEPKVENYSATYMANHPGHAPTYETIDFDNIDVKNPGIGGFGGALDLGVEWDLEKQFGVKGLKISASVLDLGFIKWKDVAIARNNGDTFEFEGFNDIKVKDGSGTKFEDQTDDLEDKLEDLYRLEDGGVISKNTKLAPTLNVAVEYALPNYRHLKFGLLSTTHFQSVYSWNEERASVTISPCKMFEVSVNGGYGTFGGNVGWIINFHPRGFNFFLGSDHCVGKLSKQYTPLRSSYDICMGINYPIGRSRIAK